MIAIEHVIRGYELILKPIDDCMVVVDRDRLCKLHRFERILAHCRNVEFILGARLMHGHELHAVLAELFAPEVELVGALVDAFGIDRERAVADVAAFVSELTRRKLLET